MELTRRNFVQGALVAGIGGAALAGCSSQTAKDEGAQQTETASAGSDYATRVTETVDCDICVVGAGMSGLSAAVESLLGGADVLVLESMPHPGGNGNVTSNVMGVGTKMQQEAGIEIKPVEIIATELSTFNYYVDGSRWATLIENSADNIEWLMEQGCTFAVVDNYHGAGVVNTAHEWTEDAGRTGNQGYVTPMCARVEELGGVIRTETAGKEIIMDGGKVAGLYAEMADGVLQVNCKAVILATGGYADNMDLLAQKGYNTDEIMSSGTAGHNGDGVVMAIAAGGKSWLEESCLMEYPMNPELGDASRFISRQANVPWVNGFGRRFTDEAAQAAVPARAALAVRCQDVTYELFDTDLLHGAADGTPMGPSEETIALIEDNVGNGVYMGQTIAELAQAAGIDPETLQATVDKYNTDAAAGEDTIFGKIAEAMIPVQTPPFYLVRNNGLSYLTTIGGIDTTANCEVRAADGSGVIEGLYAVGTDGVENYRNCYTIDIPGSCNANNINSGRTAAKQACKLL